MRAGKPLCHTGCIQDFFHRTMYLTILQALQQEFPEVFNGDKRSRSIKHSIVADIETLTETPVARATRRLNPEQYNALRLEIKRLTDQGILERSLSPWTSPIVMVKKMPRDWRLCADITGLNKVLKMQKYALPNINDFGSLAHELKWFSCLDIADAYYNIPVNPTHKHKLTITTPLGNYSYNYLPMGLASSSCYYQRLMNKIISGLLQVYCYLDDIIIMSEDREKHIQLLRKVFKRLQEHGMVAKRKQIHRSCR